MLWAKNAGDRNVFWLEGSAGTGKSTIAQSFSEMAANEGSLGATFFCSRDHLGRRELKKIFPTLAYQLAWNYPQFRHNVISIIKKDPTIAHNSLALQFEGLLVVPLSEEEISCVIVIDALDECVDDRPVSAILSVLGRFAKRLPLVKFFITGRPEPWIRAGFRLPLLESLTRTFLLHGVELLTGPDRPPPSTQNPLATETSVFTLPLPGPSRPTDVMGGFGQSNQPSKVLVTALHTNTEPRPQPTEGEGASISECDGNEVVPSTAPKFGQLEHNKSLEGHKSEIQETSSNLLNESLNVVTSVARAVGSCNTTTIPDVQSGVSITRLR